MQKIVINTEVCGFSLSEKAVDRLIELGYEFSEDSKETIKFRKDKLRTTEDSDIYGGFIIYDLERDHPLLIQTIEELGSEANDSFSDLQIVEIPDDVEWEIMDCGTEWIAEKHRKWFGK